MSGNPYNWQSHNPTVQIPREGVEEAAKLMRGNGSAVVMGGRGMGKSVFLQQLKAELATDASTKVLLFEAPPAALTVEACLGFLAESLDVSPTSFTSRRLFDEYFARGGAPERLVLLFDEFDRYAEKGASSQPPGRGFFNDLEDLDWLLGRLHRASIDFFRPSSKATTAGGGSPRLVPESVFTAHLALGFGLLGWRAEREAQRGAGRTDLILRRNGDAETAVVEVKIWGRNEYREAQRQVESYWTAGVTTAAVVQLTDAELTDWPQRYRRECLEPLGVEIEVREVAESSPIRAHFHCTSSTADGLRASVDHLLLRLPRRR